ncbi:hypothetical protein BH11BAC3_BH11BAC3_38810 [soil metagenome]
MKKIVPLLLLALFSGAYCNAQFSMEPYTGYQHDLNNHNKGFNQYNTGLQLVWKLQRRYEFLFLLQGSLPFYRAGIDSVYTTNPSLPVALKTPNSYRPKCLYIAAGQRFKITNPNSSNALFVLINLGICYQSITVRHNYDKVNYVILNPDITVHRIGPYISTGLRFMHATGNGGIFAEAVISSPPAGGKEKDYFTYNFLAPLAFNVGYSISLSKK